MRSKFQPVVPSLIRLGSRSFVTCTKMEVASTHSFHLRHLLLTLHLIFTLDLHLHPRPASSIIHSQGSRFTLKAPLRPTTYAQFTVTAPRPLPQTPWPPQTPPAPRTSSKTRTNEQIQTHSPHRPQMQKSRRSKPRLPFWTPTNSSTSSYPQSLASIVRPFAESQETGKLLC